MQHQPEFIRARLLEAVRRRIADDVRRRSLVSAAACADEILDTYPHCGLDRKALVNEVIIAASKAGAAVEIGGEPGERKAATGRG